MDAAKIIKKEELFWDFMTVVESIALAVRADMTIWDISVLLVKADMIQKGIIVTALKAGL